MLLKIEPQENILNYAPLVPKKINIELQEKLYKKILKYIVF